MTIVEDIREYLAYPDRHPSYHGGIESIRALLAEIDRREKKEQMLKKMIADVERGSGVYLEREQYHFTFGVEFDEEEDGG